MGSQARITGLGTNPRPLFVPAMEAGYAIVDNQNQILVYTVASNRGKSWRRFARYGQQVAFWKRRGFKCVPVMIKEYERR